MRLLSTAKTKMWIGIAVLNLDACNIEDQRLYSSDDYNNKVYINVIDKFYIVVHARGEGEVEPSGKFFKEKLDCPEEKKINQNWGI